MKKSFVFLTALAAALIAGCASTTAVMPAASSKSGFDGAVYSGEIVELEKPTSGAEVFRIFQQGATGFVSLASVRGGVEEIATQFCTRKGKAVHPVQERTSVPPHILGNFPRVEWLFECIEPKKSTASSSAAPDKYERLERLKKLLDSGTLTQAEFDSEKAKLLAASQ